LSLLTIKDILGEDSCWSIGRRVVESNVEGVVVGGCRVVWEERESWVIGIFVLLIFIYSIIVDGRV